MEAYAWSAQRRSPIICDRAAHRQTIATNCLGFAVGSALQRSLQRPHATTPFLQFLFSMTIRLKDCFGRFSQVMKLAELVWNGRKDCLDCRSDGFLAVRDDTSDWDRQISLALTHQRHKVTLGRAQERAGKQYFTREAIADDPEHLVSSVRLEAVKCQDDPALCRQKCAEAFLISEMERDEFLVALDELLNGPLGESNTTSEELLVDLTNTSVLGEAQAPDKRNHIEAELTMRQCPGTFLFWAIGAVIA